MEGGEVRVPWISFFIFRDAIWDAHNLLIFRKEELTPKMVAKLILAWLYTSYMYDVHKIGRRKANELWKAEEWSRLVILTLFEYYW